MRSLFVLICIGVIGSVIADDVEVNIAQGTVLGTTADGGYFEFHGIPYADSTAGSHRFKAPLAPPSFTDTFNANRRGIKCIRSTGSGYEGTEDCLVLDVFTPSLSENLPVMVWIKGTEFDRASHDFSFQQIVQKDVVVISLNFRESIFGFLCLGTEIAPGNAGLKDIIAGLRWVKENIASFGGNPDDVTLFGHGTGAAAIDLVTLSPIAEGLVHKAISQSGSALAPWAVSRDNLVSAVKVAEALGHTDITDIEQLSEIFTRVSVSALMAVINEFDLTDNSLLFSPCVEKEDLPNEEPFLTNTPMEIITEGRFLQIPFIIGFVDTEGTIRAEELQGSQWLSRMEESFPDFLQSDLKFDSDDQKNDVATSIKRFYFEDDAIAESIQDALNYHGHTMVLVSAIREARLRSISSTSPVYLYQFSYKSTLGGPFVGPIEVNSAAHSEELAYLFHKVPLIQETDEIPERDLAVADILIERWTNFAIHGNPTSETSQVEWQQFTVENPHYLRILDDEEIIVESGILDIDLRDPHPEVVAFWNEIYEEHFLDAQSNWNIVIRDDDNENDVIEEGSGEEESEENGNEENVDESGENGNEENVDESDENGNEENVDESDETDDTGNGEGDEDDGSPDSASTAVGYTFLIISAFAVLQKIHTTLILS